MGIFEKSIDFVRRSVEEGAFPGAALAIGSGRDLLVQESFGYTSYTEEKTPVNERTMYDMASVTKIMSTTMIALRFIAEGKLDLADTLAVHLKEEQIPDDKKEITIFHLMTHTSGYTAYIGPYADLQRMCWTLCWRFLLHISREHMWYTAVSDTSCLAKCLRGSEERRWMCLQRRRCLIPWG